MPVVYLPEDKRWEKLGEGLGAIGGAMYERWKMADAYKGVTEMKKDPNISAADLPGKVYSKWGPYGSTALKQITDQETKQAQLTSDLATATINRAHADVAQQLYEAQLRKSQADASLAQRTVDPNVKLAEGAPGLQAAQTRRESSLARVGEATEPAQITSAGAKASRDVSAARVEKATEDSDIAIKQAQAQEAQLKIQKEQEILQNRKDVDEILRDPAKMWSVLGQPAFKDVPDQFKAMGIVRAQLEPDPAKKMKELFDPMMTYAGSYYQGVAKSTIPGEQDRVYTRNLASEAESVQQFINDFKGGGAQQIGLIKGANLATFLENHGIGTGKAGLINMMISQRQQIAAEAQSGAGFGGEWRRALAQSVTPGVTESPLAAALSLQQVARKKIAEIQNGQYDINQGSLNHQLEVWTGIANQVKTSHYAGPNGKENVIFDGNAVDTITFKPLIYANRNYKDSSGVSHRGVDIINAARNPVDPSTGKPLPPQNIQDVINFSKLQLVPE